MVDRIILLIAKDKFLAEAQLKDIKVKLFGRPRSLIDYDSFNAQESNIQNIINSIKTPPFVSKKRLVHIKQIDDLKEPDSVITALDNPPEYLCVVLESSSDDVHPAFRQLASKFGRTIVCKKVYEDKLPAWIINKAGSYDKRIDADAVELLAADIGNDLSLLSNTIEDLANYTLHRPAIKKSDVEALVNNINSLSSYDFLGYVYSGDLNSAMRFLSRMDADNNRYDAIMFIGLLGWNIIRLKRTKELIKAGSSREAALGRLGLMNNKFLSNFDFERFSLDKLKNDLGLLSNADMQLKTSVSRPNIVLENLILKLAS